MHVPRYKTIRSIKFHDCMQRARRRLRRATADSGWSKTSCRADALEKCWPLKKTFGWYDLTITAGADSQFLRRSAGHLENGRDSATVGCTLRPR
jgi:hypothetical protein